MSERIRDPETSQWHLDKRLNAGHLITTLIVFASVVAMFVRMEQRTADNAAAIENLRTLNERVVTYVTRQDELQSRLGRTEGRVESALSEIKAQLRRIESKVDDKADK